MTLKQLSIFVENRSGRLLGILDVLANHQINVLALTVADTAEFGIIRLIVSDPQKATQALKDAHFSVNLNDVLCIQMGLEAGSLRDLIHHFSDISFEYVYAFCFGNIAATVIRTDDREQALQIVEKNNLKLITEKDLK